MYINHLAAADCSGEDDLLDMTWESEHAWMDENREPF